MGVTTFSIVIVVVVLLIMLSILVYILIQPSTSSLEITKKARNALKRHTQSKNKRKSGSQKKNKKKNRKGNPSVKSPKEKSHDAKSKEIDTGKESKTLPVAESEDDLDLESFVKSNSSKKVSRENIENEKSEKKEEEKTEPSLESTNEIPDGFVVVKRRRKGRTEKKVEKKEELKPQKQQNEKKGRGNGTRKRKPVVRDDSNKYANLDFWGIGDEENQDIVPVKTTVVESKRGKARKDRNRPVKKKGGKVLVSKSSGKSSGTYGWGKPKKMDEIIEEDNSEVNGTEEVIHIVERGKPPSSPSSSSGRRDDSEEDI